MTKQTEETTARPGGDLHTKYRPKTFEEVVGQGDVVKSVKRVLAKKSCRAFIFTGEAGTGKTTLARIIAREVGVKPANLLEVNGAINTGIDDMRGIADNLLYAPMGGGLKGVIVDEAHRLSANAWDALLKPIEEPPPHVYWFFCTTNAGKIPQTIVTRCTAYTLKGASQDAIGEVVERVIEAEGYATPEEVVGLVVQRAEGSFRRALTLLAQVAGCKDRKEAVGVMKVATTEDGEVIDLCRALIKGNPPWEEVQRLLEPLKGMAPESVRIVVTQYFAAVALSNKSGKMVRRALEVLDNFATPYPQSPNLTPVLLSLGNLVL